MQEWTAPGSQDYGKTSEDNFDYGYGHYQNSTGSDEIEPPTESEARTMSRR